MYNLLVENDILLDNRNVFSMVDTHNNLLLDFTVLAISHVYDYVSNRHRSNDKLEDCSPSFSAMNTNSGRPVEDDIPLGSNPANRPRI